jgi:hypothetical protein
MNRAIKIALALLTAAVLILPAMAVPTTGAATAIGDNNATLHATGAAGASWFVWGMYSGKLYLKTTNTTPSGGAIERTVWDFPIYPSTKYYFKACDTTGCGSELSFTTAALSVPTPQPMGGALTNMTETHFDYAFMPRNIFLAATAPFQPDDEEFGFSVITTLMLFGIIVAMWFRGQGVFIPASVFLILGFVFVGGDIYGIGPTALSDWVTIGYGLMAAGFAGIILSLFKKG